MTNPMPPSADDEPADTDDSHGPAQPACVMVFNASDPTGSAGMAANALAIASVGAHLLPVLTGVYVRDTSQIYEHVALDDEAVGAQARAAIEDITVQVIMVGFAGSPENLSSIAALTADYEDIPVVSYMPNLSWWDDSALESYLDAFGDMVLPQTTLLVGNYNTLWRWLLPDWEAATPPEARDIARAADARGTPFVLITGMPRPDHALDNVLASPNEVVLRAHFERRAAVFVGAGDTLAATVAALLASGADLGTAAEQGLSYLDRALDAGFCPGMGHMVPDRLFWAQPQEIELSDDTADSDDTEFDLTTPASHHDLKH